MIRDRIAICHIDSYVFVSQKYVLRIKFGGFMRRHHMETFSALLALCDGNSPVTGKFPSQRPVPWNFDVFFICSGTNGWANHRGVGDLRCHRAHYGITVTCLFCIGLFKLTTCLAPRHVWFIVMFIPLRLKIGAGRWNLTDPDLKMRWMNSYGVWHTISANNGRQAICNRQDRSGWANSNTFEEQGPDSI